jgi:hypothetical protein
MFSDHPKLAIADLILPSLLDFREKDWENLAL